MKIVSRKEWKARKPRAAAVHLANTRGVKVHYTGSPETTARLDPNAHGLCTARVQGIQNGHMDGNGWTDIGYSFICCSHGYVYEGRGLHALPAANGKGLNAGHYAVLGLVGTEGLTEPTDAMLHGIRDAIEYCRTKGGAGGEIKGHRDGYATSCPGPKLYAWVKAGAPRPKTATTEEELVKKLPTLARGAKSSEHMETLRALLRARSHQVDEKGAFDEKVDQAVRAVQKWGRVEVDGVVGPDTWAVLLRVHG